MSFAKQNPKIPEGINTSTENSLKEFFIMFGGVLFVLGATVALLMLFANTLAPYIPFRYEQQLSNKYAEWSNTESDQSVAFLDAEAAIQELGQRLATHSDLAPEISVQLHLLKQADVPNAFATLGGHIFVTTGLLKEVSSENALAMVIAHEIAHIKFRHPAKSLSGGLLVQLFLSAITGGQNAAALQSTAQQTGLLTMLGFSRQMESNADDAALNTLKKYYGHLEGTEEFFSKVLAQHEQARWQALFTSHPDLRQRIDHIQRRAQQQSGANSGDNTAQATTPLDPRLANFGA
jgi:beta-barrel assembly-enhancing protease